MTGEQKLRPCPFCGNEEIELYTIIGFYVTCEKCGAEGPGSKSKNDAICKWNRRVEVEAKS